ncbi:MAG TPA: hypothetical protein VGG11_21390 [Xanthobacteraceae bacterium]|jgi:hypothetical protein
MRNDRRSPLIILRGVLRGAGAVHCANEHRAADDYNRSPDAD